MFPNWKPYNLGLMCRVFAFLCCLLSAWLVEPTWSDAPLVSDYEHEVLKHRVKTVWLPLELWFIRNKTAILDAGLGWPWGEQP